MFPIPGCRRRGRGPRNGEKTQAEALGPSHDQEGCGLPQDEQSVINGLRLRWTRHPRGMTCRDAKLLQRTAASPFEPADDSPSLTVSSIRCLEIEARGAKLQA